MNRMNKLLLVALVTISGVAHAALDPVSYVVELAYTDSPIPAHEADRISVKPCASCDTETVRFSTETAYRLSGFNSTAVSLTDFSQAVRQIEDKDALLFYVRYAADTKLVEELVLSGAE